MSEGAGTCLDLHAKPSHSNDTCTVSVHFKATFSVRCMTFLNLAHLQNPPHIIIPLTFCYIWGCIMYYILIIYNKMNTNYHVCHWGQANHTTMTTNGHIWSWPDCHKTKDKFCIKMQCLSKCYIY